MSINLSEAVRNARLDAIETIVSTSAKLMIYTGSKPTACADAATGTKIVEIDMASDWAAAASGGQKALNSIPLAFTGLSPGGVAGYFRITASNGTTCHLQGTVTATGDGGDMTIDNTSIATDQTGNITGFTLTDGNA